MKFGYESASAFSTAFRTTWEQPDQFVTFVVRQTAVMTVPLYLQQQIIVLLKMS
jgi:hypothetical protein